MNCKNRFLLFVLLATVSAVSTPTSKCFAIVLSLPGDFNLDGIVDVGDYPVWRNTYWQVGGGLPADADGDGVVDSSDYQIWRSNFGAVSSVQTASSTNQVAFVLPAPEASVVGVVNGDQIDWRLYFTSSSPPGSLGIEFVLEIPAGALLDNSISVLPDFMETIDGVPIQNPGNNPFTGTVTQGISSHLNTSSVLLDGPVDGIFAPLGSTVFADAGPHLALEFSTTRRAGFTAFGGIIAEDGISFSIPTAIALIPEPTSGLLASLALAVAGALRRRNR